MKKDHMAITSGLARFSLERSDQNWIIEKINDDKSRIIPVYNSTVLCENSHGSSPVFLTHRDFTETSEINNSCLFLGVYDEIPYFAKNIDSDNSASLLSEKKDATFRNLRSVLSVIDSRDCELLTLASFMTYWHARNHYCGKCGTKTKSLNAGHVRICRNDACREHYFPSMDPAVIVLISSGERCLLGRKKEWRKGMYSTLAGFVEPGETAEDAVVREIMEEVGVPVEKVQYQHSQPWLFPGSLMLGFTAVAQEEEIILEKNELEDAGWFTREEIRSDPHLLPYKISIAHKLITEWLARG